MHQALTNLRCRMAASTSAARRCSVLVHSDICAAERTCAWAPPMSRTTDRSAPAGARASRCCWASRKAATWPRLTRTAAADSLAEGRTLGLGAMESTNRMWRAEFPAGMMAPIGEEGEE